MVHKNVNKAWSGSKLKDNYVTNVAYLTTVCPARLCHNDQRWVDDNWKSSNVPCTTTFTNHHHHSCSITMYHCILLLHITKTITGATVDSLRWSSQRCSRMPRFWGLRKSGAMIHNFKLGRDFCTMHLHPSFIILCLLVQKLSCWQTNRRRWKHPMFFAVLVVVKRLNVPLNTL